ncbi:MAG: TrmO family methyltransferase domain-containing protein [Actinomycetota bacterium]
MARPRRPGRAGRAPAHPHDGVLTTRSQDRPNPIGLHRVHVVTIDGTRVLVRDLEAFDETPIIDVKPVLDRGATPDR